jgi:methyl-accepting chemotaxis protein
MGAIATVDSLARQIAGSVEQQASAAHEIAGSVDLAAAGAADVRTRSTASRRWRDRRAAQPSR